MQNHWRQLINDNEWKEYIAFFSDPDPETYLTELEETMTDVNEIYPSKGNALKASDLNGKTHEVVIDGHEVVNFENGRKIVLRFLNREKTLVCNKTNAMIVSSAYGKNPDNWIGKKIEIYPDKTTFQGGLVDCIRVRIPTPKAEAFEDDIPFN